ncbi:MAG: FUSC family membrane protein [Chitinophagaceae bacterium]
MDYIRAYRSFITSHYLSEGVRMTIGILMPAFIFSLFDNLPLGIVVSIGALSVCPVDNAGPILHRRNGMMISNLAIFIVALTVGIAAHNAFWLGVVIVGFCFLFSMLGVYGARASSIGIAAMLVMVLNLEHRQEGWNILWNALYITAGGVWYMLFSIALYSFRPYKLIQQALGDCIQGTAEYLRTRAAFYSNDLDYDATYRELLQQQVAVQEKQNLVSELLFKTRSVVKESTNTSRVLVMIYLDIADLFERVMTSYQDYTVLHAYFKDTGILERYRTLIFDLANELDEIGIAVKIGKASHEHVEFSTHLKSLQEDFVAFRSAHINAGNIDGFITLRHILTNIEDLADSIRTLHHYTTYDRKLKKKKIQELDYEKLITHQDITPVVFWDNLSLQSNIFRHSLRVCIAVAFGYLMSLFFHFGHGYWILLTIIVILKPAYSLTRKRNRDRLIGTLSGIAIGIIILYFVRNETALLVMMVLLMAGAYSFMRIQYFVSVLLMTPYLLLFFHLLYPHTFESILVDRLIDTAIGSVIAFIASMFLVPTWEHEKIKTMMTDALRENRDYFTLVAGNFAVQPMDSGNHISIARKTALVGLANLSDAFNRMLSEPRSKQKDIQMLHKFVVLNHMLVSHIATLATYIETKSASHHTQNIDAIIKEVYASFTNSITMLEQEGTPQITLQKDSLRLLNAKASELLEKRQQELKDGIQQSDTRKLLVEIKPVIDQFNFIYNIAVDINKICSVIEVE